MTSWISVAARDGSFLAELPDLVVPKTKQTIGRYEPATALLPVSPDVAPQDWIRATKQGASFIVQVEPSTNDPRGTPVWGGLVNRRIRNETDLVQLDLITGEGYLDRRYVGDETFEGVGQNAIVEALIETYIVDGAAGKNGLPIRVEKLDGDGTERVRTYEDKADKTIYSVLDDLAGVKGGPEWSIGWEWQSAPERLTMVLYVGSRIGSSPAEGLAPAATFDMPGNVRSLNFVEDFGVGRGANDVMATSSGEGTIRPQSEHATYTDDPDRPTFEHRFSPSTSIKETSTLDAHAQKSLEGLKNGVTSLSLAADFESAPVLGLNWFLGDDVSFDIEDSLPAFPDGLSGVARVFGWERTFGSTGSITPILISSTGAFDG